VLMVAVKLRQKDIVQLLLDQGADVTFTDKASGRCMTCCFSSLVESNTIRCISVVWKDM